MKNVWHRKDRAGVRVAALVCVVAVIAVGCGDDNSSSASSSTGAATTPTVETTVEATVEATISSAPTSTATPSTVGAPELSGDPVKILTILDESTPSSSDDSQAGIEAGVAYVNANGGIQGRELVPEFCRTALDGNVAGQCARDAVDDEAMLASVGSIDNTGSAQTIPTFEADGMPVVNQLLSLPPELASPNVFSTSSALVQALATPLICQKDLGLETFGLIYIDVPGGAQLGPTFEALGVKPVANVPLPPGSADATSQAAAIVSANPDCLGLFVSQTDTRLVLDALSQQGYTGRVIISAGTFGPVQASADLGDSAEGLIIVHDSLLSGVGYDEYLARLEATGRDDVAQRAQGTFTISSYLGVLLFAEVANSVRDLSRASILDGLKGLSSFDTMGLQDGPIDFTKTNTTALFGQAPNARNTSVIAYEIVRGEAKPLTGDFVDGLAFG